MSQRLAVLYSHPSSYTRACFRVLKEDYGWEIFAIYYERSPEAPFAEEPFEGIAQMVKRSEFRSAEEIRQSVRKFKPDMVYIAGWMDKCYVQAARLLRKDGIPVVAGSDTQYTGKWRQQVARIISPWYLKTAIDVLWVTGNRQRQFAEKLGYRGDRCWEGMYCCDWEPFAQAGDAGKNRENFFLFVGRYIPVKGLDVLLDAYADYRASVERPWGLKCAGAGELGNMLRGVEGVTDLGFVQPSELPELMACSGGFVLPSRKEPWGVVIQEAAAARMPIICSDSVGAGDHLVTDGGNGFIFESENSKQLALQMVRLSERDKEKRVEMGRISRELSLKYTPKKWAQTLIKGHSQFGMHKKFGEKLDCLK